MSDFKKILLSGIDAEKFLQGQVTLKISDIKNEQADTTYQATAICSLKGRIEFGIWLQHLSQINQNIAASADTANDVGESFAIVIHDSCLADLLAHIKKFGAFSKFTVSEPVAVYPCVLGKDVLQASFSDDEKYANAEQQQAWEAASIASGNYWITKESQSLFQPQELRLHQRGGVSYNKGCYLGQEVIARIYFRSAPKAFLHRIKSSGSLPSIGDKIGEHKKIQVVNAIAIAESAADASFEALVITRENHLTDDIERLPLPPALQEDVGRQT